MLGIAGVVLALVILTVLSFYRWSPLICGLSAALVAGLLNGMGFFEILTDLYIPGVVSFIGSWLLVFVCGTVYAELMSASGAVAAISGKLLKLLGERKAIFAVGIITAALVYGGINVYAIVFVVWPICLMFSQRADIPKRIWVPVIYLGMMSAMDLPGSPAMSNVLATSMLNVSSAAGPVLGIVAFAVNFVFGSWYLTRLYGKYKRQGLGYEPSEADKTASTDHQENLPGLFSALMPIMVLLILYMVLSKGWLGGGTLDSADSAILSMLAASIVAAILYRKRIPSLKAAIIKGADSGISPVITAAAISGFVAVISGTQAFDVFVNAVSSMPGHPYFQVFVVGNLVTMVTGSATVAVQTTLDAFAASWIGMGMNVDVIARLLVVCVGGMSLMPHSGGLYGVMGYTGSSHKESYLPTLIACGLGAILAALVVMFLALVGVC